MTDQPTGRDWLTMTPAHFDSGLLPRKHRRPEAEGLFSVADVAPNSTKTAKTPAPEMEGQAGLFDL